MQAQLNTLATTLPQMLSQLNAINQTVAGLNLAVFTSQVNQLTSTLRTATDDTSLLTASIQGLTPRVGSIERMISQLNQYNNTVWYGLTVWASRFQASTLFPFIIFAVIL